MVANVTVSYDPNVAVDHAVVKSLLRSSCIDKDITSIVVMFNNGEENFYRLTYMEVFVFVCSMIIS